MKALDKFDEQINEWARRQANKDLLFLSSYRSQKESVIFNVVALIFRDEILLKNAADLNRLVYQGRDTLEPHLSEVEVPEILQLRIVKPSVQISPSLENPKISYMYVT